MKFTYLKCFNVAAGKASITLKTCQLPGGFAPMAYLPGLCTILAHGLPNKVLHWTRWDPKRYPDPSLNFAPTPKTKSCISPWFFEKLFMLDGQTDKKQLEIGSKNFSKGGWEIAKILIKHTHHQTWIKQFLSIFSFSFHRVFCCCVFCGFFKNLFIQ